MSDSKEPGSFLNRWSTRKRQAARSVVGDEALPEVVTESEKSESTDLPDLRVEECLPGEVPGGEAMHSGSVPGGVVKPAPGIEAQNEDQLPVEDARSLLVDADMPAVDTLTSSSDISGFFSKGVSAELRKAALRHVFRQPSYNVRDGLDDYDGDYTSFEPLGDTVTADMKFHAARKERARQETERLAEEQVRMSHDSPGSPANVEDDPSARDEERAERPVEDELVTVQEDEPDDDHERHQDVLESGNDDSGQGVKLAQVPPPEQTSFTNSPLNKSPQTTASQPCETPNE